MAGGAGVGAPPADLSVGTPYSSARYAAADAWLCRGDTVLCGASLIRTVLGPDGTPYSIAASLPATDCFVVATADPVPTARALAPVCTVHAPSLTRTTAAAASDETLDAFRHFVDNQNDGRPFVVVSDSTEGGRTSLTVLDEIRSRRELRSRYVASILPGLAVDFAAEALPFCTVLEHLGCVMSAPVVRDSHLGNETVPGISTGWAGACVNPADVEGEPALLPDWMVVDDGTSTVDCDVLALVEAKIEALGLVRTTDSR